MTTAPYEDGLRDGQWLPRRGIRVWQPRPVARIPACPKCGVGEGRPCITRNGHLSGTPHAVRNDA